MLERMRKDVTGFVAEFTTEKMMEDYFLRNKIKPPEQWIREKDNFIVQKDIVKKDIGRILELAFGDKVTDTQVGDITFYVSYDYVHCWA